MVFAVLFLAFIASTSVFAETIGVTIPRDWAGNGVRIQSYPSGVRTEQAVDLTDKNEVAASASYDLSDIEGWGQSKNKELKGYVDAEGYDYRWQAGGFYRDQIYIETANGLPVDLAMTFHITATGNTYDADDASAFLSLGWNLYYGSGSLDYQTLGYSTLIDLAGASLSDSYSSNVTLHTVDSPFSSDGNGYLIQSGTYVPYSVSVWGTVINGNLDWGNTVEFVGYTAFQNGVQLTANEFTIREGIQSAPVPEPSTILLLGLGLAALAGAGRKFRK
jgi:hypothetical protein